MSDITNRIVKICRRITDIEYAIACKDQGTWAEERLRYELEELEAELKILQSITQM